MPKAPAAGAAKKAPSAPKTRPAAPTRPVEGRAIAAPASRPEPKPEQPVEARPPAAEQPAKVERPPVVEQKPKGAPARPLPRPAARVVALNDLNNLRLFIDTVSLVEGRMPTVAVVRAALRKEAPRIDALIEAKAIVLTGARSRQEVWAYTEEAGGQHLVVMSSGVERMSAEALQERLQDQEP
jgi:hypothetical protein